METLVKMTGVPEDVLNILVKKGYFKTKTEAIRAGILRLGKEYNVLKSLEGPELELVSLRMIEQENEMRQKGQRLLSEDEVKEKHGLK